MLRRASATTKLRKPQRKFTTGLERPRPGGRANGLGNASPSNPLTRCGMALHRNAPAKKSATSSMRMVSIIQETYRFSRGGGMVFSAIRNRGHGLRLAYLCLHGVPFILTLHFVRQFRETPNDPFPTDMFLCQRLPIQQCNADRGENPRLVEPSQGCAAISLWR